MPTNRGLLCSGGPLISAWRAVRFHQRLKGLQELLAGIEGLTPSGAVLRVGFPLPCLPIGRPIPHLRQVHGLLRTKEDALICQFGLKLVTHFELRRPSDLRGQRELSFARSVTWTTPRA